MANKNRDYTKTEEYRNKMSVLKMGHFTSEETKEKIGLANKGKLGNIDEKNGLWAGDKVGYNALHTWVQRKLGKAFWCTFCFKIREGHKMHWANISHQYKRDLTDWMQLCVSCHREYDRNYRIGGYTIGQ